MLEPTGRGWVRVQDIAGKYCSPSSVDDPEKNETNGNLVVERRPSWGGGMIRDEVRG